MKSKRLGSGETRAPRSLRLLQRLVEKKCELDAVANASALPIHPPVSKSKLLWKARAAEIEKRRRAKQARVERARRVQAGGNLDDQHQGVGAGEQAAAGVADPGDHAQDDEDLAWAGLDGDEDASDGGASNDTPMDSVNGPHGAASHEDAGGAADPAVAADGSCKSTDNDDFSKQGGADEIENDPSDDSAAGTAAAGQHGERHEGAASAATEENGDGSGGGGIVHDGDANDEGGAAGGRDGDMGMHQDEHHEDEEDARDGEAAPGDQPDQAPPLDDVFGALELPDGYKGLIGVDRQNRSDDEDMHSDGVASEASRDSWFDDMPPGPHDVQDPGMPQDMAGLGGPRVGAGGVVVLDLNEHLDEVDGQAQDEAEQGGDDDDDDATSSNSSDSDRNEGVGSDSVP